MKKLACQVSAILFLLGFLAGPALAVIFKSSLHCFEEGVSGKATIKKNGTLKVKAKGLEPNTDYEVELICGCAEDNISDVDSQPFEVIASTKANGTLKVSQGNAVKDITCHCPAIVIEDPTLDEEGVICTSGVDFQPVP